MKATVVIVLGAAAALLVSICSDDERPSPTDSTSASPSPQMTAHPTATGGGGGGGLTDGVVVTPKESPSPLPTTPADWPTYSDPDGYFVVEYPPTWFAEGGIISTFKLGSVGAAFPTDGIKVDIGAAPIAQLGSCTPDPSAWMLTLGAGGAWRLTKVYSTGEIAQSDQIWIEHGDYCYTVLVLVGSEASAGSTFDQILSSLRLGK